MLWSGVGFGSPAFDSPGGWLLDFGVGFSSPVSSVCLWAFVGCLLVCVGLLLSVRPHLVAWRSCHRAISGSVPKSRLVKDDSRVRCLALCGHCGWPRRWFVWICVLLAARVGEATHPGPNWTLGVANLNGLNTRAFTLAESTVDSWLFSETHLTAPGEKAFRANLREAKAPYTSFVGGSPVPARSEVSDIGQWSGVGVLSKYPVRRLSHKWPEVVYRSGRLVCVSICCQGIWVSGVVVYGTPTGHTHVNGREVTNELLSLAIARVNLLNGPCFVAGDFNHDLDRLPAASVLSRLQFEECQDVHARLTGILPQATCRGKTRRDFLFMSRELCALFDRCEVDDNTVSDHAALICHFHGGRDLLRYSWPLPDQIEWEPTESRRPVSGPLFCPGSDVTVDYRRFWVQAEANNNEARRRNRKPEIRAMNGRATVLEPQVRTMQVPPLKASRPGDRQPLFLGSCLQHVQWTKQLRRLQSFVRLARAPVQTSAHCAHVHSLWSAIRSARGFVPSFGEWWSSRELGIGEPLTVPIQPPVAAQAALFYLGLELEVDSLEKALMRSRSHAKRLLKASDAQAMYAAVRRDAPAQVDSLVATVSGVVGCVDEAECALELTCPTEFNEQQPLVSEAGLHQIIHAEADKVWVDSCNGVAVGQAVGRNHNSGNLKTFSVRLSLSGPVCGTATNLFLHLSGRTSWILRQPISVLSLPCLLKSRCSRCVGVHKGSPNMPRLGWMWCHVRMSFPCMMLTLPRCSKSTVMRAPTEPGRSRSSMDMFDHLPRSRSQRLLAIIAR